jgi:hypothetical protein
MAEEAVWFTCPSCKSRFAIAAENRAAQLRCPKCLKPIESTQSGRAGEGRGEQMPKTQSPPAPVTSNEDYGLVPIPELDEPRPPTVDLDEDVEYTVAPLETAPPKPEPITVEDFRIEQHRAQDRWGEPIVPQSRRRAVAGPLADVEPPARPAPMRELPTDILTRDEEREAANRPLPPPRWTFFSGIFTFPWWPQAMFPWVVLSLGLLLTGGVSLLIAGGYASGTPIGTVTAGIFGIGWIWLALLTFSYAAACLFAIIEMTAYNFDRREDWPEPDWRERTMHLLWVVWCAAAAMMIGFGIAEFTRDPNLIASTQFIAAAGITTLVFFPIFILSTLETNSMLWIVSGPILRSLIAQFLHWAVFYTLSIGMFVGLGWLFSLLGSRGPWMALLVGAPLEAAAIFIYARLIGRLAWRIMRPGELEKQAQRDAQHAIERRDLAAGRR